MPSIPLVSLCVIVVCVVVVVVLLCCRFFSPLRSAIDSNHCIDDKTNPKNEKEAGHNDNSGSKDGSLEP